MTDATYDVYMDEFVLLVDSGDFSKYKRPEGSVVRNITPVIHVRTIDGEGYFRFEIEA